MTAVPQEFLTLFEGADRGLRSIFHVWGSGKVLTASPGFPMYEIYAKMFNCLIENVDYTEPKFPLERFVAAIQPGVSLVVLSNPSSPIGDTLSREQITHILERCCHVGAMLVVDETYVDFSNLPSCEDMATRTDNMIVLRSMSKSHAAAGLRTGYTVSSYYSKKYLKQVSGTNELNAMAIKWIAVCAEYADLTKRHCDSVKRNRDDLVQQLLMRNVDHIPSQTNFIHAKIEIPYAVAVVKYCEFDWSETRYTRFSIPGDPDNFAILKNAINLSLGGSKE
jgi:histidinol-phosphate aminotransferase